jgi:hypothetical protein
MNKKILIPAITLLVAGGILYTSTQISAHGFGFGNETMIQKLAAAFGKSEDEVKAVLDDVKADHQAEMQSQFENRLDEAVANGDLTEEQKQLILAKHEEIQSEKESWNDKQNLSKEEWIEIKQNHHSELESWAEENGIDLQYFFGGRGMHKGMHKDMHGFGGFGKFAK